MVLGAYDYLNRLSFDPEEFLNRIREAAKSAEKMSQARVRTPEVVIVYSLEDRDRVREIWRRLGESDSKPRLDLVELLPGETWELHIENTIRNADFVIVCLSSRGVQKRGYAQKVVEHALGPQQEMANAERRLHFLDLDLSGETDWQELITALKTRTQSDLPH